MWYECTECIFASNSSKEADRHSDETRHEVAPIED